MVGAIAENELLPVGSEETAIRPPDVPLRRVLAVLGPKGGIGKTSLARNIAVAGALSGLKVALADLDAQKTAMKWFSRRPEGAVSIAFWSAELSDVEDLLAAVNDFDLLVVDTPPGIEIYPEHVQRLIAASDLILIPCGPSSDETESVIPWMHFVARSGRPAAFILTRATRNTISSKEAKLELNRAGRLCPIDIPASEDIKRAGRLGLGIMEIRGGFGAEEVNGVWHFVRNELGMRG